MKRLKQKLHFYYLRYKVWRFTRAMKFLFKHGRVRDIQWTAERIRELGEQWNLPEYKALADQMEKNAENVVMRRVLK